MKELRGMWQHDGTPGHQIDQFTVNVKRILLIIKSALREKV